MAKPRKFADQFKAKVALEALRGDNTLQEIAAKHQLHPNQGSTWKRQAIEGTADVFSGGQRSGQTEAEVKDLHAKLVRLSRSALYCASVGVNEDSPPMMKEIDRVVTKYPFFGSHQIAAYL